MAFIDTHTHLFSDEFKEDIDSVIDNAIKNTVTKFYLPNVDESSYEEMMRLSSKYPSNCFPLIGIHPCSVTQNYHQQLDWVKQKVTANKQQKVFHGIGEIGIDLYWDKTLEKEQKKAFAEQIEIAIEFDLPIIIHTRNAFNEAFEIVSAYKQTSLKGIFHCFSGTITDAEKVISLNTFKLGIGGVLTFKNSGLDKVVELLDLKHLVLETDSPYLAPTPYRGKRNESKYLTLIATKLAEIKKVSVDDVAAITTKNAIEILGN
ncbi:MAG: TatD family hydrolase [Bacteroidetes bacterium]|nr:TatD family hydrolase [Bacteroidota bacterium]